MVVMCLYLPPCVSDMYASLLCVGAVFEDREVLRVDVLYHNIFVKWLPMLLFLKLKFRKKGIEETPQSQTREIPYIYNMSIS